MLLTTVENKIPNASNFVKKTYYDEEILDIKSNYFTTADYNKFTNAKLDLKIKQKELVSKSDIADLVKNFDLSKNVAILATKADLKTELKSKQDKIIEALKHLVQVICVVKVILKWWHSKLFSISANSQIL